MQLHAIIPENWPPETLADALSFFLRQLEAHPQWLGWLSWYAINELEPAPTLVGGGGFLGPPDAEGLAEIGYSMLPQHQHRGLATEMVGGMIAWARDEGRARGLHAQTTEDNVASRSVLASHGFIAVGPGKAPGHTSYRLHFR